MQVKVYTTQEVAKMFEVSDATIRREIERGKLECFHIGNIPKFTMYHLEQYTKVKQLGKTKREIDLEEEKEKLLEIIQQKNDVISNIKNLLLQEVI